MRTKIELTKEQVDQIFRAEEMQLWAKFDKDLALMRIGMSLFKLN